MVEADLAASAPPAKSAPHQKKLNPRQA